MTQKQTDKISENGIGPTKRPDPEVVAQSQTAYVYGRLQIVGAGRSG